MYNEIIRADKCNSLLAKGLHFSLQLLKSICKIIVSEPQLKIKLTGYQRSLNQSPIVGFYTRHGGLKYKNICKDIHKQNSCSPRHKRKRVKSKLVCESNSKSLLKPYVIYNFHLPEQLLHSAAC